jgi:hypothetical protein
VDSITEVAAPVLTTAHRTQQARRHSQLSPGGRTVQIGASYPCERNLQTTTHVPRIIGGGSLGGKRRDMARSIEAICKNAHELAPQSGRQSATAEVVPVKYSSHRKPLGMVPVRKEIPSSPNQQGDVHDD